MIPLDKVIKKVEYNNIYSMKQVFVALELAFVEAEILKNKQRAQEVIKFAEELYTNFVKEEIKQKDKTNLVLPFWKNKAEKLHKYLIKRYNGWK
jgi:hypothetical protein